MENIPQKEEEIKQGSINPLYELLRSDGSIVVNKALVHAIGLPEAILFAELISRFNYFAERGQLTEDGYFFNTIDDLQAATGLSAKQQKNALNNLETLKLLNTRLQGMPAKRHFKMVDNLNILGKYLLQGKNKMKLLKDYTKPESLINQQFGNISETGLAECAKQDSHNVLTNNTKGNNAKGNEEAGAAAEPSANGKAELGNIIGHYKELFSVYADTRAQVKDEEAKALKLLLQDNSAEDIKNMITLMFQDADPYWLKEGYPLLVFAKQRNKFAARLAEKKKGANKNNAPKEGQPFTVVYGSTSWQDHLDRQQEIERKFVVDYEEPASGEPAAAEEVKAGFATVKGILAK